MVMGGASLLGGTSSLGARVIDGYCGLVREAGVPICTALKSAMLTATDRASSQIHIKAVHNIKQNIYKDLMEKTISPSLHSVIMLSDEATSVPEESKDAFNLLSKMYKTAMPTIDKAISKCQQHRRSLGKA